MSTRTMIRTTESGTRTTTRSKIGEATTTRTTGAGRKQGNNGLAFT